MPSEEDHRVVKLQKEVTALKKKNFACAKKIICLEKTLFRVQRERDNAIISLNGEGLSLEARTLEKDTTIAELQEELRRSENSRRDTKRTMTNLIINTIICLDGGLPKAQRDDVVLKLSQFRDVDVHARNKFEIIPEQLIEEKKLIADAAEAVEKVDADELEAAAKEVPNDTGK
jgi:hypothetical protein